MATVPLAVPTVRFATVRLATGVKLHYAEQGAPDGPALVLLHGYSDSWFSFSRLLPLLPPAYHVYALSLRGHGDSERPATGYGIDALAADVVALLDAVGVDRVTLVGHSLGSIVARHVAATRPDRVRRLALIGTIATPVNEAALALREEVRALEDPVPEAFVREFQASTILVPVPEAFFERVVVESLKLPARVWQTVADGFCAFDDSSRLRRIAAPTLVLWGAEDAYFPREEQDRIVAGIPSARLTVYAETGHSLQWERPERVARDLEAFVGGGQPAPAAGAGGVR
jgi:non-heme chloroperoxidase